MQKFILQRGTTAPIVGAARVGTRTQLSSARRCLATSTIWNSGGVRRGLSFNTSTRVSPLQSSGVIATPGRATSTQKSYASSSSSSSGKSTPDEIVEELQDLYEIAKDEFEIASDSTSSSTIYAASDRTTAREALDDLLALYEHYTAAAAATGSQSKRDSPLGTASPTTSPNPADSSPTGPTPAAPTGRDESEMNEMREREADSMGVGEGSEGGAGGGVRPNFNAEALSEEVREEVRRRVGQRVRELRGAVEALEERAMEE